LSNDERTALSLFLAEQKSDHAQPTFAAEGSPPRRAEGRQLVEQFRCGMCHQMPEDKPGQPAPRLGPQSHWDQSCLATPEAAKHPPGYRPAERDARAGRAYYSHRHPVASGDSSRPDGRLLLVEHNCLACHAREGMREEIPLLPPLLADKLTAVAQRYPDL